MGLIAYASRTGTRSTLDALRDAGWRLLLSATGSHHLPPGFRYALDNGAWTAHQSGTPFDVVAFERLLSRHGDGADWVVAPDIVAGGLASLDLSLSWLRRCQDACSRVLLAVQDGMAVSDVRSWLAPAVGIFVGGSTEWKLHTLPVWGALGCTISCVVHVGRVNTVRRIRLCRLARVTSFDGTSVPRYPSTLALLDRARSEALCPL